MRATFIVPTLPSCFILLYAWQGVLSNIRASASLSAHAEQTARSDIRTSLSVSMFRPHPSTVASLPDGYSHMASSLSQSTEPHAALSDAFQTVLVPQPIGKRNHSRNADRDKRHAYTLFYSSDRPDLRTRNLDNRV